MADITGYYSLLWNEYLCIPPNSYVEVLLSFEAETVERQLGHKGEVYMMGVVSIRR